MADDKKPSLFARVAASFKATQKAIAAETTKPYADLANDASASRGDRAAARVMQGVLAVPAAAATVVNVAAYGTAAVVAGGAGAAKVGAKAGANVARVGGDIVAEAARANVDHARRAAASVGGGTREVGKIFREDINSVRKAMQNEAKLWREGGAHFGDEARKDMKRFAEAAKPITRPIGKAANAVVGQGARDLGELFGGMGRAVVDISKDAARYARGKGGSGGVKPDATPSNVPGAGGRGR